MVVAVAVFAAAVAAVEPLFWRSQTLNADGSVALRWAYDGAAKHLHLNLTARLPAATTPGWLGLGFSPDGAMHNGDFIIGFAAGGQACVRAAANGATAGMPPTLPPTFNVTATGVAVTGATISIAATRPLTGANPIKATGAQKVLFAAGSAAAAPQSCGAVLSSANQHDLGAQGFVGAADVAFSGSTPRPTPAPPSVAPPAPGIYCSVCDAGLCFPANLTVKDAKHFSYYDPQLRCPDEAFRFVPSTGELDISADMARPSDCFAQAANRTHSTFRLGWNGTHLSVANSLFPEVFLVPSKPAGGICAPPS
eukprot:TRINITY_DN19269_c0_g1_i1.p1 TRINITY_DN19269_c0_g1~~TRINITY_DN19269_c0_g1_i1.p1  ORF type:complete len:332 (+),score=111.30 TRINITY_DN19269_c0_g1_i1:71-997(+)